MYFSVIALLAAAASASALPFNLIQSRQAPSCDVLKCAVAVGPTAASCTAAAVQGGSNAFSDVGCLAGSVNLIVNHPQACAGCGEALANSVNNAVNTTETAVAGVANNVANATSNAATSVANVASNAASDVGNAVSNVASDVGNAASNAASDVSNAISSIF